MLIGWSKKNNVKTAINITVPGGTELTKSKGKDIYEKKSFDEVIQIL